MTKNMPENNIVKNILTGIIKSFIITFILIMLISLILVNTNINESTIGPGIFIITCISIFVGAMSSIKSNGIINGGIVGIIYILTIYLLSSILNGEFGLTISSLILIVLSIFSGMIGRNSRSKYKKKIKYY